MSDCKTHCQKPRANSKINFTTEIDAMWKYIFNNIQVKVAITVDAVDDEAAWNELKNTWNKAAEMRIDLPPIDTFTVISKTIL
jgi:hypothetical protein